MLTHLPLGFVQQAPWAHLVPFTAVCPFGQALAETQTPLFDLQLIVFFTQQLPLHSVPLMAVWPFGQALVETQTPFFDLHFEAVFGFFVQQEPLQVVPMMGFWPLGHAFWDTHTPFFDTQVACVFFFVQHDPPQLVPLIGVWPFGQAFWDTQTPFFDTHVAFFFLPGIQQTSPEEQTLGRLCPPFFLHCEAGIHLPVLPKPWQTLFFPGGGILGGGVMCWAMATSCVLRASCAVSTDKSLA
jgi:hypothetical protein